VALLAAFAFVATLALAVARAQTPPVEVTFGIAPVASFGVNGEATLFAIDDTHTVVALALVGLDPGAEYVTQLHGGSCDQPSASFTDLPPLQADANGAATAIGVVRFHEEQDIPLPDLTDGDHLISVGLPGQVVACGAIPAV
jgi:hypothetical protein